MHQKQLTVGPTFQVRSCCMLLWLFSAALACRTDAQEEAASFRLYEDGALTADDYQTEPPDGGTKLDAVTTSDLKYDFSYQVFTRGRRATAYVKEVTVQAIVKPGESWNRRPTDTRLLDHEQGHFDITYAWALKARIHFTDKLKGRNGLTSVAGTSEAAVAGLHRLMQKEMQAFLEGATASHHQYDQLTSHGTRSDPQAEQRTSQKSLIADLTKQLERAQ